MILIDQFHAQVPSLNPFQANILSYTFLEISEKSGVFRMEGEGNNKGRLTGNGSMYRIYNVYVYV